MFLSDLRHSFIVPFLGICTEVNGLGTTPCIIFPWYENGTLENFLSVTTHSARELLMWTTELVKGMEYLHEKPVPVLHGDLRAGNILVDDERHIRIADFGLAQLERQTQTMTRTSGAGTPQWKAPEMFPLELEQFEEAGDGDEVSSEDYTLVEENSSAPISVKSKATDTWAVGCTMYEIYEGKYPYHYLSRGREANDWRVLDALRHGKPPATFRPEREKKSRTTMPVELWDTATTCWHREPSRRPDMSQLRRRLDLILV